MSYYLVLLFCAILIALTMFVNSLTFVSSCVMSVFFSKSGCSISTPIQTKIKHEGIINRLIKYVAHEKATSNIVRYIKFFITYILTEINNKSRGELK